MAEVVVGDCLDVMRGMDADSIDAIVTDSPYALTDVARTMQHKAGSVDPSTGRERSNSRRNAGGFMGKAWDAAVPGVEVWAEALRVAKPGAHLLAMGGTRTHHRLMCAIEDAGWGIRDTIASFNGGPSVLAWVYGTGFPKSLDVSKAMDKVNGETDRLKRFTAWMRTTGLTSKQLDDITSTAMGGHYLTAKTQPAIPTPALWALIRPHIGDVPIWVDTMVERIAAEREVVGYRKVIAGVAFTSEGPTELAVTVPATDLAKQWQGWGTGLKPSFEIIILARKPLVGTVAANVAEHGTGALNIDASRVSGENRVSGGHRQGPMPHPMSWGKAGHRERPTGGRWPSNVLLVHAEHCVEVGVTRETVAVWACVPGCPVRTLDEQSGERTSGGRMDHTNSGGGSVFANRGPSARGIAYVEPSQGGASRFFFTSKASRREREAGLDGLLPAEVGMSGGAQAAVLRGERYDAAAGLGYNRTQMIRNTHPTVKPLALMRWLCRLITPPSGKILDPFLGSGSTGCAAALEGFRFVGIEREEEYAEIARRRIAHWSRVAAEVPPELFDPA